MTRRGAAEAAPDGRERVLDPRLRTQDALDRAYRYLAKRDRSEAEIRAHLVSALVEPGTIDEAVAELVGQGYVDDARYALRFAEDRRSLDDWGAERIARRLAQVGIAAEHVDAALGERDTTGELEAAVALLRRRFAQPPADGRERDRALGVLVRKGYELELAYDAVRAFACDAD